MHTRILFFGMLKEHVGRSSEETDFPEGADLRAVFDRYANSYPALKTMAGSIVMARNREFAPLDTRIADGDEIAFLPPVSGGDEDALHPLEIVENGNYFALTRHTIDPRSIAARVLTGGEGAVVTFEGTVRNNTNGRRTQCLDYECYEAMAIRVLARIGAEIAAADGIHRVAIVHRLGRLLIGETSVAVVVTAPHRRAAFEAALAAIDRVKKQAPIWKKEHFADGEVWVEGEWDRDVPKAH